ncbi:MAG: hypothetical protein KJO38_07520, partial [Gammaproteobacteria bacterium]|nr:hypothetical protein [Gammaproteobacteria bacterium]
DLDRVIYVRLVDIVGDESAANALTPDNLAAWLGVPVASLPAGLLAAIANPPPAIYDPFPTVLVDGVAAGFDLDAIAVLNAGPPAPAQPVPVPVPALLLIGIALAAVRLTTDPPARPTQGK